MKNYLVLTAKELAGNGEPRLDFRGFETIEKARDAAKSMVISHQQNVIIFEAIEQAGFIAEPVQVASIKKARP